jgi:hypothetical protein
VLPDGYQTLCRLCNHSKRDGERCKLDRPGRYALGVSVTTQERLKPRRPKVVRVSLSEYTKRPASYRAMARRGKTIELVDKFGEVLVVLVTPDKVAS